MHMVIKLLSETSCLEFIYRSQKQLFWQVNIFTKAFLIVEINSDNKKIYVCVVILAKQTVVPATLKSLLREKIHTKIFSK